MLNKMMFRNVFIMVLSILLLMVFSLPAMAAKKETIMAIAMPSEDYGCGNREGGFYAKYNGRTIEINFTFARLKTELEVCEVYGKPIPIANKSITLVGKWGGMHKGKRVFNAEEIYLTGATRKADALGELAYIVTAKKVNRGDALRVYLNGEEVMFRGCGQGEYCSVSTYPMKRGSKIAERSGAEGRVDNLEPKGWNGKELEMIAQKTGKASLLLMHSDKKYDVKKYNISFQVH